MRKQIEIIESLQFPQLHEREENIKEAHPTTFEWLFEETSCFHDAQRHPNILKWLRDGNGTYYVSGKAGSGKSTLMKFLYNHDKTKAALKEWAGTKSLLVARFFFWNAGTNMQKNQQGLLQSLLYHILKQTPNLIPALCPSRWKSNTFVDRSWRLEEVLKIFADLGSQGMEHVGFCFFIDGLDEYVGDHDDVIDIINTIAATKAIKVCFSSRPWTVFESAYGSNDGWKIRLQDLTRNDMDSFIRDRLLRRKHFKGLKSSLEAYNGLVSEIVDRSDGVFLWVYLIVISLRRGMRNSDTPDELKQRLRELPTELETFFQHILDSSDRFYRTQAARLYLIRLAAESPLTPADVSCFAEKRADFALLATDTSANPLKVQDTEELIRDRVLARCQDLLEWDKSNHLQFLHRTVADFLKTRDVQHELENRAGDDFNPDLFICNAKLLQIRMSAQNRSCGYQALEQCDYNLDVFWYHAYRLELIRRLDHRLFAQLDRAVWSHLASTEAHFAFANFDHKKGHYEGWLVDRAAVWGIHGVLPHAVGGTFPVIRKNGDVTRRPPLEIALQSLEFDRLSQIQRLLDLGADPNEQLESGTSIWQSFLCQLDGHALAMDMWGTDLKVIELLLSNGADPDVGNSKDFFRHRLLAAEAPLQKVAELEELRISLSSSGTRSPAR